MLVHASGAELLTDALQLPKCMHMSNRKATICDALAALMGNIFGRLSETITTISLICSRAGWPDATTDTLVNRSTRAAIIQTTHRLEQRAGDSQEQAES